MTDQSISLIGASTVHGPPYNESGANAIIGIIDDGIDLLHEAFQDKDGRTRILTIWDQTRDQAVISADVDFGTVYSTDDINNFISQGKNPPGLSAAHGTRVASIAAGRASDSTEENVFRGGVAPEAHIVFVKPIIRSAASSTTTIGASFSHIAALDYVRSVANAHKLPYVINLSFGTNIGAHDGTALLETFIDEICDNGTETGAVVVKAAGNEQDKRSSAVLNLAPTETEALVWNAQRSDRARDLIDLWFHCADSFEFRLLPPESTGEGSAFVSPTNRLDEGFLANDNAYELNYEPLAANGEGHLTILIQAGNRTKGIEGGNWTLEIVASNNLPGGGRIDAWLERDKTRPMQFLELGTSGATITVPGTAQSVITVGAVESTSSLKRWKQSSIGPTRDLRNKPELSAPGVSISSARAGSGNKTVKDSGTSYAAPHVSGAIALLLSYRNRNGYTQLNAKQIGKLLSIHSQNYDGTWRPDTGYGRVDIGNVFKGLLVYGE